MINLLGLKLLPQKPKTPWSTRYEPRRWSGLLLPLPALGSGTQAARHLLHEGRTYTQGLSGPPGPCQPHERVLVSSVAVMGPAGLKESPDISVNSSGRPLSHDPCSHGSTEKTGRQTVQPRTTGVSGELMTFAQDKCFRRSERRAQVRNQCSAEVPNSPTPSIASSSGGVRILDTLSINVF